jgi:hypothetical protein
MRAFIVYTLGLVFMLAACERQAPINVPYEGDKIVLNTFIQPDSPVYIRVTKSEPVAAQELDFKELEQAQVSLLGNGEPFAKLRRQVINGRGYFVSDRLARQGLRYTVTAAATGLTAVSASDTIPPQPAISDLYAQKDGNQIRFTLKDPGASSYYRIRVYRADSSGGALHIPRDTPQLEYRLDPSFNDSFADIIRNAYYRDIVIDNQRIAGKTVAFLLQTRYMISSKYLMLEVSSLTQGAFRYLRTRDAQQADSIALGPPVKVYSNVENGYGIVAGINTKRISVKVKG